MRRCKVTLLALIGQYIHELERPTPTTDNQSAGIADEDAIGIHINGYTGVDVRLFSDRSIKIDGGEDGRYGINEGNKTIARYNVWLVKADITEDEIVAKIYAGNKIVVANKVCGKAELWAGTAIKCPVIGENAKLTSPEIYFGETDGTAVLAAPALTLAQLTQKTSIPPIIRSLAP